MRYFIIIFLSTMLSACGNKIDSFKYASEKVVETVNLCTDAAQNVCNEGGNQSPDCKTAKEPTEADLKASGGWDTRMMLR